jgi:hypothetical protein
VASVLITSALLYQWNLLLQTQQQQQQKGDHHDQQPPQQVRRDVKELGKSPVLSEKVPQNLPTQVKEADERNAVNITLPLTKENLIDAPHNINHNYTVSFHRWEDSTLGIAIEPLWQYMQELVILSSTNTNQTITARDYDSLNGPIPAMIFPKPMLRVAIHVYRRRLNVQERMQLLGPFLQQALMTMMLLQEDEAHDNSTIVMTTPTNGMSERSSSSSFSHLRQALHDGGLPLIFLADDFTGCLKDNYNYTIQKIENDIHSNKTIIITTTIPFLTLSASPHCGYSFAIPSYAVLHLAKTTSHEWDEEFEIMDQRYPWKDKKPMAVWRGALSGTAKGEKSVLHVPRIQLLQLGKQHPQVLDVALACTSYNGVPSNICVCGERYDSQPSRCSLFILLYIR